MPASKVMPTTGGLGPIARHFHPRRMGHLHTCAA